MAARLRAAVIGTGFAGSQHADALRRIPGADLVAISASSVQRAAEAGARLGVARTYGDHRQLLADETLDVIHVCVPNDRHLMVTADALASGHHVISEKPLARDVVEAQALVQAADASDRLAVLCHNYRFYSIIAKLREMAGANLGRLHTVRGAYLQDWLLDARDMNWRIDPIRGGPGRTLGDIGTHWLDLAEVVTGRRVTEVLADVATVHPRRRFAGLSPFAEVVASADPRDADGEWVDVTTEDTASLLLRFDDGLRGSVDLSQVAGGHKNDLELSIDGTAGSATWRQERADELLLGWRDRPNEIMHRESDMVPYRSSAPLPAGHHEGWSDALRNLIEASYAVIRGDLAADDLAVPLPTFRDGLHHLQVVEAALASTVRGEWIKVSAGQQADMSVMAGGFES